MGWWYGVLGRPKIINIFLNGASESMSSESQEFDDAPTAGLVTTSLPQRCPHCGEPVRGSGDSSFNGSLTNEDKVPGSTSEPSFKLQAGQAFGQFLLQEYAGRGTFGTVWKAKQIDLNRTVALKIPHKAWLTSDAFMRRLGSEAQAAAALSHPNILDLLDFKTIDGIPVLVTKFISGVNLEKWLVNHKPSSQEAANWVAQLADALDYVHREKIVHRDVKPGNVMLVNASRSGGRIPILIDFGLALRDEAKTISNSPGVVVGTPAYLSPEQAMSGRAEVDGRSDIYSLGVLLYRMVTGVLPYYGTPDQVIALVRKAEPRWPRKVDRTIPRDLETIIMRAMAREPWRRFETAADMAADLRHYLNREPISSRPVGHLERATLWIKRKPALATAYSLAAAGLLAAVAFSGFYLISKIEFIASLQRQNANKAIESGVREGQELHRPVSALFNYLHALEEAPAQADDLHRVARLNLAAWFSQVLPLERIARVPPERRPASIHPQLAGKDLAIRNSEGKVHLWREDQQDSETQLLLDGGNLTTVSAFSPDGRLVALKNTGLHIYELNNGIVSAKAMVPFSGDVINLSFSPGGQYLAIGSSTGLQIYDRTTAQLHIVAKLPKAVTKLWFISDNSIIALTGTKLLFWSNWRNLAPPAPLVDKGITAKNFVILEVSPTGLAAIPDGNQIKIVEWSINSIVSPPTIRLVGPASFISFSPDGSILATLVNQNQLQLWDTATGHPLCMPQAYRQRLLSVFFHPDGKSLYLTADDLTLRKLRMPMPREDTSDVTPVSRVRWLRFSEQGNLLMAGYVNGKSSAGSRIRFWSFPEHKPIGLALEYLVHISPAFSANGRLIAYCASEGKVELREVKTGKKTADLTVSGKVLTLSWTHDNKYLIVGDDSGNVHELEVDSENAQIRPLQSAGGVTAVASSPDDHVLLTGTTSGEITAWNMPGRQRIFTISQEANSSGQAGFGIDGAVFGMQGTHVAVASGKEVRIRTVADGDFSNRILRHDAPIRHMAWDGVNNRIATGSDDGITRLWDGSTGAPRGMPMDMGSHVYYVAFSPDGKLLLAMCSNGKTGLWDTATCHAIGCGFEMDDQVYSTAISPDGNFVATGDLKGAIRIRPVPQPVGGDVARLRLWIQVLTGMEDDPAAGGLDLSPAVWADKKRRLEAMGGPPLP